MAGSQGFSKFTIVLGVIVFIVGAVSFVSSFRAGNGTDVVGIVAMAAGIVAVIIGRRRTRGAGAGSGGM